MGLTKVKQTGLKWKVRFEHQKYVGPAYKELLRKQGGSAIAEVFRCEDAVILTWKSRHGRAAGVTYKTAFDLVTRSLPCVHGFKIEPVVESVPDPDIVKSSSLSPVTVNTDTLSLSLSEGLRGLKCEPDTMNADPPASPMPAAPIDKYDAYSIKLELLLGDLVVLFGKAASYEMLAKALSVLERLRRDGLSLPGPPCTLLSFAITMCGCSHHDEKRQALMQHFASKGAITVKTMREAECKWVMFLPFERATGV